MTVVSLMNSSRPISALDRPRVIPRKTSSSRVVRVSTAGGGGCRLRRVKCRMTLLVTDGDSSASPAATVESLVRSVQAEPTGGRAPWGWIAGVSLALCVGLLVVLDRWVRRRP